jgi:hypothetical protein
MTAKHESPRWAKMMSNAAWNLTVTDFSDGGREIAASGGTADSMRLVRSTDYDRAQEKKRLTSDTLAPKSDT